VRRPQTNGFVERFQRTVLDEFFRPAFRTKFYDEIHTLQDDLDAWGVPQGYRNMGKRPLDPIQLYLKSVQEET
jgi:transposase InsO family protein